MSTPRPARPIQIGPSLLSADFLRLGEQIDEAIAAGADFFHFDVMDGQFVPNISMGIPLLEAVHERTTIPVDVHLMVAQPDRWVEPFARAGADRITIHVEADPHCYRTLRSIEEAGALPGVSLNPGTSLTLIEELLPVTGQILIMSVNPGFGGQTFIPSALAKIRRTREWIDERRPGCLLEVDGGIKPSNIGKAVAAGADTIVVGSAMFNRNEPVAAAMQKLREAIRPE